MSPTVAQMHDTGKLRIWWIPQIPGKPFYVPVSSPQEAKKLLSILGDYDLFQFKNGIKPDFCNLGGLEHFEKYAVEGKPGWCDWYDEETGLSIDEYEGAS